MPCPIIMRKSEYGIIKISLIGRMINIVAVENKALLDIKELCEYLGIGQNKARELVRGCNGFGILLGGKWYAHKKKLDAWLEREAM